MYYYTNQKLAWLCIPKNASTSLRQVFHEQLGWTQHDLYTTPRAEFEGLEFFACLRDPDWRHAMGIVQYLASHNMLSLLEHAPYNQLLASAVLDEHSMPLHFAVPQHVIDRCTFFIMDSAEVDFIETFTAWLNNKNVRVPPVIPRLNQSVPDVERLRHQVQLIKKQRPHDHNKLTKWALARDMILYNHHKCLQNQLVTK